MLPSIRLHFFPETLQGLCPQFQVFPGYQLFFSKELFLFLAAVYKRPFNSDNENAVRAEINNSLSAVEGQLTQADIIWVYNNVEYVLALDAGWSKHQAGNFIALFLQELKSRLDAMARAGGSR